ncbi:MAG: ATP-binding cassette domain-containing protein [Marinifilaceae bacterium]|jgi:ATP-binding cassette subfamily F protein 3|nr:ATP-binding cassette domain-containing protein [Marinifilaceae bacterium]
MISVNQLSVYFGDFILFDNVSFQVNEKDRIGLAGKNGAGKSTLLKIFANIQEPTHGNVACPSDLTIGYLPQHMLYNDDKTLMEDALTAFDEVLKLKADIEALNVEIGERNDYESEEYTDLINKLTEYSDRYYILGGDNIRGEAEKTLMGLGFLRSDFDRDTSEFSGGWRMRLELVKILLKRPDILLLDEPTNHLDIESIQWLEDFLKTYNGAVILVSHDKAFLDGVTNRTIEISLGQINDYKVPYSQYIQLRKERREQQLKAFENQQKMIKDTEEFIEKYRYKATKAVQVQSRIKQLEKVKRIEVDQEDVRKLNIRFAPAARTGDIVAEGKELTKRFGEHLVLDDVNFEINRGEKVAFIGKNGEGKTTLVRMIMRELDYEGECRVGHNVKIGYFAQNQAQKLDDNKTVWEVVDDIAVGDIRVKLKSILAAFMFAGEEIDKKVKVLSGGERSRLAMVKLMLEPYNVLILDEPTNHLDIRSKDILKLALKNFDGTVVLVSHDRDFLDGLVDKMFEFGNKKIKEHIGGIYEFLEKKKLSSLRELEIKAKEKKENVKAEEPSSNKLDFLERKELNKKIKKLQTQVDKAEQNVANLEEKIAEMDKQFANPDGSEDEKFYSLYEETKKQLEIEIESWEESSIELDEMLELRD